MASERHSGRGLATLLLALLVGSCFGGPGVTPIRTPFNRGVWHHENGDLEAAIAQYRLALEEDAHDVRARFNLAVALEECSRRSRPRDPTLAAEAEQQYGRVLVDDPDNLRAQVNLAAIERDRGDLDAARRRLLQARTSAPAVALPCTALAVLHEAAGDVVAAEAALREAVAREPLDFAANLQLGRMLGAAGRHEEARAALAAARRSEPDSVDALLALAELEAAADHLGEALALVEQALLQDDRSFAAHRLAAELCERRGRLEPAVFHAWQARDLDPEAPPRFDHRAHLRRLYELLLESH